MPDKDIMIVDDNPANLKLLEDMLLQQGHDVRSFPLGRLALAAARNHRPSLILLDINMPEMDGYEVCRRLKAEPALAAVPVIFLSALNETNDKVKAFRSGAVDYISKPFQFEEVHARVRTHLDLFRLQRALAIQNEKLEETVASRTRELADANERLTILNRSKSAFLTLIQHEFRTPLNGLLGVSSIILEDAPESSTNNQLKAIFERSRRRIMSILDDAALLAGVESGAGGFPAELFSLNQALCQARESAADFAESRNVSFSLPTEDFGQVRGSQALMARAWQALLETAVKFSDAGETVSVSGSVSGNLREFEIKTRGGSIPSTALPVFFDLFSISEALTPGGDLGVAPALACRILALTGGSVSVQNREPSGVQFKISLQ